MISCLSLVINKYLPPRKRRDTAQVEALPMSDGSAMEKLFAWADRLLSKSTVVATPHAVDHSGKLEG
jgi:hypothetical protein